MEKVQVSSHISANIDKVWKFYNEPEHIMKWNFASDDWHCPRCENDLRIGGKIVSRMEAKDGSQGFDFGGIYEEVEHHKKIAYRMNDGRQVVATFNGDEDSTDVVVVFDAEQDFPSEYQRSGWQAILSNFKRYVENNQ